MSNPVFFLPSCDGFLPSFESGKPSFEKLLGYKKPSFEKCPKIWLEKDTLWGQKNVKNRRKLQQFSLKIAKNVYKLQNFAKFPSKIAKKSQIFRQILLKMIKFRIFEKIAKKCSFQLGKKPSFENRFGKKFGKTPVLKNEKKNAGLPWICFTSNF